MEPINERNVNGNIEDRDTRDAPLEPIKSAIVPVFLPEQALNLLGLYCQLHVVDQGFFEFGIELACVLGKTFQG